MSTHFDDSVTTKFPILSRVSLALNEKSNNVHVCRSVLVIHTSMYKISMQNHEQTDPKILFVMRQKIERRNPIISRVSH